MELDAKVYEKNSVLVKDKTTGLSLEETRGEGKERKRQSFGWYFRNK